MKRVPKRSARFGVGKEIGGAVYVHVSYEYVFPSQVSVARKAVPRDFEYTVIKYCQNKGSTSFIHSPDFDTADEPTVGAWITVSAAGTSRRRAEMADPFIYHHKWLFVLDDYAGFDVSESRQRSLAWMALDNVDTRRIGRRSYWDKYVVPRIGKIKPNWYRSPEAAKLLGISSCELAHLRQRGELTYRKEGNSFLYELG